MTQDNESLGWAFIYIPVNFLNEIQQIQSKIRKSDLHEFGLEKESHITVKYGFSFDNALIIKYALKNEKGGFVFFKELSLFENEEYDVLKINIFSPQLKHLNKILSKLPNKDEFPTYNLHSTIAYLKPGRGEKYIQPIHLTGNSFKFSTIYFENSVIEAGNH